MSWPSAHLCELVSSASLTKEQSMESYVTLAAENQSDESLEYDGLAFRPTCSGPPSVGAEQVHGALQIWSDVLDAPKQLPWPAGLEDLSLAVAERMVPPQLYNFLASVAGLLERRLL